MTLPPLMRWRDDLRKKVTEILSPVKHANLSRWQTALEHLPELPPVMPHVKDGYISFSPVDGQTDPGLTAQITSTLKQFHPWRKGPYHIHGVTVETEWRSDLKWDRFKDHITPLKDRNILDVGCGNGYHCFRMALDGAGLVIGIDPYILSVMQFKAVSRFSTDLSLFMLPIGIEDIPAKLNAFDTVFSMGVLYHRRSPLDHLYELRGTLRSKGELVLETLLIEGKKGEVLVPEGRYAKMRNIWFIPTALTLASWLKKCGFRDIRLIDVTRTTTEEQRPTPWMTFESLPDFLDQKNPLLTVEGLPAPRRGVFIANAP